MAPLGLDAWTERISESPVPVLGTVVRALNALAGNHDANVNELSEVVLKDSNLTSQLLRVANSSLYRPVNGRISTVTHAVIRIGFEGVKSICVSLVLVDSLLGERPRRRLLEGMARAFHAAVQARDMLPDRSEAEREQAFVAALLFNLGEIVIWSHGGEYADRLHERMDAGIPATKAAQEILGTQFEALTRNLAQTWGLGELLDDALSQHPRDRNGLVRAVRLGDALSRAVDAGWQSEAVDAVLDDIAAYSRQARDEVRERCLEAADRAAEVAVSFGAARVCPLIPGSRAAASGERDVETSATADDGEPMTPDNGLQLKILRDLAAVTLDNADVNSIFAMALEGIHRGIGVERVALLLVNGSELRTKYALGGAAKHWRAELRLPAAERHLFSEALRRGTPLWITAETLPSHSDLYPPALRTLVGAVPAFCAAIHVGQRAVGCYYADRGRADAVLTQEQFDAFAHLCAQTRQALSSLASQQRHRSGRGG